MRTSSPRLLFGEWNRIAERIRRAKSLVVFLDFDGTLVGFKANPADVRLDPGLRRLLAKMARDPRVRLVFISGRRRADLRRRVGVRRAEYIGLHGFENGRGARLAPESRRLLRHIKARVQKAIEGLPGVWLQDKGASLGIHYRRAPSAAAAEARRLTLRALEAEGARLRILRGKKIWELLADEVKGKGAAAVELLGPRRDGTLALYVGDDATDETAFAALRSAVTVHVGRTERTLANYRVRDPEEVKALLVRFYETLSGPAASARAPSRGSQERSRKGGVLATPEANRL